MKFKYSEIPQVQLLTNTLYQLNISDVVVSPGSRNAPVIGQMVSEKKFKLYSVIDERSAGFYALGMAQKLQKPVVLLCTSGTALLNYAPAVTEAYYQNLSLIVISTDRPSYLIDQGEGQTIKQVNALQNFVKSGYFLPDIISTKQLINFTQKKLVDTILNSITSPKGPVHINIPLSEPLYNSTNSLFKFNKIKKKIINPLSFSFNKSQLKVLKNSKTIWIVFGQRHQKQSIDNLFNNFIAKHHLVCFTETHSNYFEPNRFACIDKLIDGFNDYEISQSKPDLLLTFGTNIISKKIKALLRKIDIKNHWHIGNEHVVPNTFNKLTQSFSISYNQFINTLLQVELNTSNNALNFIKAKWQKIELKHKEYLASVAYCDLKVFETILANLPKHAELQSGNSSVIRYLQLFQNSSNFVCQSNRGTSGIEGSLSTAIGYATQTKKDVYCILGDISFLYDANALQISTLPKNLKIIVINNQGGGIFRIIPGPQTINKFETFIETKHNKSPHKIAQAYGINCKVATNNSELFAGLNWLKQDLNSPLLLEIITPGELNSNYLNKYFNYIKNE